MFKPMTPFIKVDEIALSLMPILLKRYWATYEDGNIESPEDKAVRRSYEIADKFLAAKRLRD